MDDFCLVPWYSSEPPLRGFNDRSCCFWPKTYNSQQIKQLFLNGKKPIDCQRCWLNEQRNLPSKRQQDNRYILESTGLTMDRAIDNIKQGINPLFYQLSLSNLCNQACATCNGLVSTRWLELDPSSGKDVIYDRCRDLDIDLQNALKIGFTGGEPLYDPAVFSLLEKLINAGNTKCNIVFVTNGSQQLKNKYQDILNQFDNVDIVVSIDGLGSIFEYLRWPGNWNTVVENIKYYQQQFRYVSASYTISSLNIWYHEQTVEWFEKNNLNYNFNVVDRPRWANPSLMPIELKKSIKSGSFAEQFKTIKGNEILLEDFKKELHRQDSLKKINFQDYLPELSILVNS
jgi:sulfatase maturation enzyme AslB (radical SAM superfamily)